MTVLLSTGGLGGILELRVCVRVRGCACVRVRACACVRVPVST